MKMLSDFQVGATVQYHGEPCLILEHRKDGTLLMVLEQIRHSFGSDNDFAKSDLRDHLNGAFMDTLTQGNRGDILPRTIDLTALNGSKQYGTCVCHIAPLTFDEIRKYHDILPKPESWEWSATPWSTPCSRTAPTTPGTWAPMATCTAATVPTPTGPVPLSSSPPIMLWSRKAILWTTPPESWLRSFSTAPTSKRCRP